MLRDKLIMPSIRLFIYFRQI